MYKISEFSKITNLTVKALRYYDEQGILVPSARSESDYRLYDESDYEKAQLIVLLKKLGFSIAELKDALANCENKEDLSYYLREKKSFIEHIGPFDHEPATLEKMETFITENGYVNDISETRHHHEIYLSDPRKGDINKMKTVLRIPVRY